MQKKKSKKHPSSICLNNATWKPRPSGLRSPSYRPVIRIAFDERFVSMQLLFIDKFIFKARQPRLTSPADHEWKNTKKQVKVKKKTKNVSGVGAQHKAGRCNQKAPWSVSPSKVFNTSKKNIKIRSVNVTYTHTYGQCVQPYTPFSFQPTHANRERIAAWTIWAHPPALNEQLKNTRQDKRASDLHPQ